MIAQAKRCFLNRNMWSDDGLSFSLCSWMFPFGAGKSAAASCVGVVELMLFIFLNLITT